MLKERSNFQYNLSKIQLNDRFLHFKGKEMYDNKC